IEPPAPRGGHSDTVMEYSLFYFSADQGEHPSNKYRLLIEGAKFADENGFTAIWTPERHFHAFGGLYPNPSVLSAALAMLTRRLPRPIQQDLPVWVTTAGNPETYEMAAKAGANVLTHLLGQSVNELGKKIALYRNAWERAGHSGRGRVTLMLHTFLSDSENAV